MRCTLPKVCWSEGIGMAERIADRSWQALELTKLALRQHRPATTAFDMAAQAAAVRERRQTARMTAFLDDPAHRRRDRAPPQRPSPVPPVGSPIRYRRSGCGN